MENLDDDTNRCSNSWTILASKIYNIAELQDGINGEEYMCMPKEDVHEKIANVQDINLILLCPFCGREYADSSEWRKHLDEVHNFSKLNTTNFERLSDNKVKSQLCTVIMSSKKFSILHKHLIIHQSCNKYAKCKLCPKVVSRVSSLKNHLRLRHRAKLDSTVECNPKNLNLPPTSEYNLLYLKYGIYICPFCGVELAYPVAWRQHLNVIHSFDKRDTFNIDFSSDPAKCKQCNIKLKSKRKKDLEYHSLSHQRFGRFIECKLCKKTFKRIRSLKNHLIITHTSYVSYKETEPLVVYEENSDLSEHEHEEHVNEVQGEIKEE